MCYHTTSSLNNGNTGDIMLEYILFRLFGRLISNYYIFTFINGEYHLINEIIVDKRTNEIILQYGEHDSDDDGK